MITLNKAQAEALVRLLEGMVLMEGITQKDVMILADLRERIRADLALEIPR